MRPYARSVVLVLVASSVACGEGTPATDVDAGPRIDAGIGGGDGGSPDAAPADASIGDGGFQWPVPTGPVAITPSEAWKNRITPTDPFVRPGEVGSLGLPATPRWVKFVVLMRDPSRVYFQDSNRHAFHYDFIRGHLDPYLGVSRDEADRRSLHERDQELILGAVLLPPDSGVAELGIQLARKDTYHPEMARLVLDLVRRGVDTSTGTRAFYFPTYEQSAAARAQAAFFEQNGFPVSTADRWGEGAACYARGWALGRLVYVATGDIDAAYVEGRLRPDDVLLTDAVPAELPFVAGILSLEPGTPNSHVAILARSHGVPFAYVRDEAQQALVRSLGGREVVVRADAEFGQCALQVRDASGAVTPEQKAALLALKAPVALDFPAKAMRGVWWADVDQLGPADARFFGGKAANYGLLRDEIPQAAPRAVALSFDLWDVFMAQPMADRRTLGATIRARLATLAGATDPAAIRAALGEVRALIEDQGTFAEAQRAAVFAALAGFDSNARIRFRSSTNVEDGRSFSGAGLYDSESGCVADDTDEDQDGPSQCDPARADERGVFRAIKEVYASFYSERAYLERARRGVDEARVAMGVLVHAAYADADELANGVATVTWGQFSQRMELVTQLGAVSVANPEGGARPEVVDFEVFGDTLYPTVRGRSSLVPLGASVMTFRDDYDALGALFLTVGRRFAALSGRTNFTLDLEYKKLRSGALVVKQVREVPHPGVDQRMLPAFLLGETATRCTAQAESGDVFANHRLKSRWTLRTQSAWLRTPDIDTTTYGEVELEVVEDGAISRTAGVLSMRPGFSHAVEATDVVQRWLVPGSNGRSAELRTSMEREVRATSSPIRTLDDAFLTFSATWATPVFDIDFNGAFTSRSVDFTVLGGCPDQQVVTARTALVEREAVLGARSVRTSFWWPEGPGGIGAGYTAPLHRWRETVIEGFTARPIVLRGYWSQTYRPGHHNFSEDFIFEPRLEEGISPAVVAELETANVRWIHVQVGKVTPRIAVMGVDGVYRRL